MPPFQQATLYDPHTGRQITEQEFANRYGGVIHAEIMRLAPRDTKVEQATVPGLKRFGATCPGCGVGVSREVQPGVGEPCPECRQKPQYQAPMFQVGEQPRPAYNRETEPATD